MRQLVDRGRSSPPGQFVTQDNLIAWLKAEGLVRDPTPEEQRLASEWQSLPDEEKQVIQRQLDCLPPGPMVSDLIIENRC